MKFKKKKILGRIRIRIALMRIRNTGKKYILLFPPLLLLEAGDLSLVDDLFAADYAHITATSEFAWKIQ